MKSTDPSLECPDILKAIVDPEPEQPEPDPRAQTDIIDLR